MIAMGINKKRLALKASPLFFDVNNSSNRFSPQH